MSAHPQVLHCSLERGVIPCFDIIKETLVSDENNQDLIGVLQRSYWDVLSSVSRLKCNIAFLESCGIVGSQLSYLLKKLPCVFCVSEPALRDLISRVVDMGFPVDSRALVHAVRTVSSMSRETFSTKIESCRSLDFSEEECMDMFRSGPTLLMLSEGLF